jgi:hypothetical protein
MKYVILTLVGKHKVYAIPQFLEAIKNLDVLPEKIYVSAIPHIIGQFPMTLNGVPIIGITGEQDTGSDRIINTTSAREKLRTTFLETDYEWSLWLDNDMLVPSNLVELLSRLLEEHPGTKWAHSYHPARQGTGEMIRHGMGSSFVHRDILEAFPFILAHYQDKWYGDDQIFITIMTYVDRLYKLNMIRKGLLFPFKHLKANGEIISIKGHEVEYE